MDNRVGVQKKLKRAPKAHSGDDQGEKRGLSCGTSTVRKMQFSSQ